MIASQSLDASPQGCGKLATFHVVARDEVPGNVARVSRPEAAPDIRPIPSHGLAVPAWLTEIQRRRQLRKGGSPPHEPPPLDSGHPKSTVDIGRPALTWGDGTLFRLLNPESACPKPAETLGILGVSRTQTEIKPNHAQKLFSTLDLGCLPVRSSTSRIASRLTCYSPSPGGGGWGEGELTSKFKIDNSKLKFFTPAIGKYRLISPNTAPSPLPRIFSSRPHRPIPSHLLRSRKSYIGYRKFTRPVSSSVGKCRPVSAPPPRRHFLATRSQQNYGLLGPIGSYSGLFRPSAPPGGGGGIFSKNLRPGPARLAFCP
jgi:hypothetical protein